MLASRFVPQHGPKQKRVSIGQAHAAKFLERLCNFLGDPKVLTEAQLHILNAQAEQVWRETGQRVAAEDIEAGQVPSALSNF